MHGVSAAPGGRTSHTCVATGQEPGEVKVLVLGMGSDPGRAPRSLLALTAASGRAGLFFFSLWWARDMHPSSTLG